MGVIIQRYKLNKPLGSIMSFLKNSIISSLLCLSSIFPCFAAPDTEEDVKEDVSSYYTYGKFSLGFQSSLSMDIGHRYQCGHHGIEGGIGITSLIDVTEGHIFSHYIFYPLPSETSQLYIGIGVQGGIAHLIYDEETSRHFSPNIIFGKEFCSNGRSKKFIQVNADIDSLKNIKKFHYSSLSISAGFGF